MAVSQNSSEPEIGAADATALAGEAAEFAAFVCAVAKLVRSTVSLFAKKKAAPTAAIVAPAERPSQNGRICCLVILRTSKGLVVLYI
jgi:hypothetical protein